MLTLLICLTQPTALVPFLLSHFWPLAVCEMAAYAGLVHAIGTGGRR